MKEKTPIEVGRRCCVWCYGGAVRTSSRNQFICKQNLNVTTTINKKQKNGIPLTGGRDASASRASSLVVIVVAVGCYGAGGGRTSSARDLFNCK